MAINITKEPYLLQPAFNPVIFEFQKTDDDTTDFLEYQIECGDSSFSGKIFFYNNIATVNIAPFLCKLFQDVIDTDISDDFVSVSKLFTLNYNFYADGSGWEEYKVMNAVAQIGKSLNFTQYTGQILSEFSKIKKYENFPLELSLLSYSAGNTAITAYNANSNLIHSANISNYTNTVINVFIDDDDVASCTVGNPGGNVSKWIFAPAHSCTPEHPFYVRWINQRGGWEYFMFEFRQIRKYALSDIQILNPLILDTATAALTSKVISAKATESITAGVEGLITEDFEILRKIIYSPLIQFYSQATGQWKGIYIEKAEIEKDNRTAKNFEVEFILPEPLLQF